jgi:hypothetical protein
VDGNYAGSWDSAGIAQDRANSQTHVIDSGSRTRVEDAYGLDSFEAVITRPPSITRAEISAWVASRDWTKVREVKNVEKTKRACEKHLPSLASRKNLFDEDVSARLANIVIAALADDDDPVAEFLFSVLTLPKTEDALSDYGL